MDKDKTLGIYIHLPFCAKKCAYCDFYSLAGREERMDAYQKALLRHIRESADALAEYTIDTVYFGGGTPSFYGADRLIELFSALKRYGRVLLSAEVTLEANPDSVNYHDLLRLRRQGFNRISIGAQCADDHILRRIGRIHTFSQVEEAVRSARAAGFQNVSLDLIYGLPGQTRVGWAETLNAALNLKPDHLSCYGLKIEEGTPLWEKRDDPTIPDDDTQADMYLYTVNELERHGFRQYEISNFARRGCASRHNLKYWQGDPYLGFGAAAHSFFGNERFSFVSDLERYIDNIADGWPVVDSRETISAYERACEYIMLGLRTTRGISEEEYYSIFPCKFDMARELMESYVKNGWMQVEEGRWSFTPQGFLLSNTLIGDILAAQTRQRASIVSPWKESPSPDYQFTMFPNHMADQPLFPGV
ncbi:MAG: radical SAM family heme chaperone HemW [bacterium]